VLTSYLVANAVILPASNWFARRFGRKRFLLICVILFTIASFFCGAAPSLGVILLARILQGAGGGALQPLSQSILLESFPVSKRSMSMAAYGLGIVLAPVIGPTLGGWLTDTFSWRYAFYINIPVGILAVILISRFVHDPPYIKNAKVGPFDNIGFGLLMVWTGCLQIVLDKGQEDDWFGAIWVRWAVAALGHLAGLWIWHSWTNPKGLVDLHVLKDRNFRTGCFMIAMLGMCIYITIAILPLYYQEVLGYTAFTAGLVVGPRGIGSFHRLAHHRLPRLPHRPAQAALRRLPRLRRLRPHLRHRQSRHRPLHSAHPHHPHRLCAQLCLRPLATMATSTIPARRWATPPASSTCCATSAGRSASPWPPPPSSAAPPSPDRPRRQPHPVQPALQQKSAAIAAYLGHHLGPRPPAPAPSASSTASCSSSPPCSPTSMSSAGPRCWPSSAPPPPGSSKSQSDSGAPVH
jgi:MFS family permease